jgi:hypothetical protein
VVPKTLEPVWKPFRIAGSPDTTIKLYFYDYDDDGSRGTIELLGGLISEDYAGMIQTTLNELTWHKAQIPIINQNKIV